VQQSIIQICDDTLNQNSSLSFHFREETNVSGSGDNISTITNWFIDISVSQDAIAADGGSAESVAKQFEDLEMVNAMLSPEEYTKKRPHILEKL
jgi:hypothetical protein